MKKRSRMKENKFHRKIRNGILRKLWSTHLSWFPRSQAMFCVKFYCLHSLFGWLMWLLLHSSHRIISIVHLTFVCHCNRQRRRCFYRQQQLEKIVVWSRLTLKAVLAIDLHLFHRKLDAACHRHYACLRRECDGYCHNLNISNIRWDWLNYNSYRSIEAPMQLFPFLFVVHNMTNWMFAQHLHSLGIFYLFLKITSTQNHHRVEWKLHKKKSRPTQILWWECGNAITKIQFDLFCCGIFPNPFFFFSSFIQLCPRRLCAFSDSKANRKSNVHRVYWTADRPYLLVFSTSHSRHSNAFPFCISFHLTIVYMVRETTMTCVSANVYVSECAVPCYVSLSLSHSNDEVSLAVNFWTLNQKRQHLCERRIYFDLVVMFCQI